MNGKLLKIAMCLALVSGMYGTQSGWSMEKNNKKAYQFTSGNKYMQKYQATRNAIKAKNEKTSLQEEYGLSEEQKEEFETALNANKFQQMPLGELENVYTQLFDLTEQGDEAQDNDVVNMYQHILNMMDKSNEQNMIFFNKGMIQEAIDDYQQARNKITDEMNDIAVKKQKILAKIEELQSDLEKKDQKLNELSYILNTDYNIFDGYLAENEDEKFFGFPTGCATRYLSLIDAIKDGASEALQDRYDSILGNLKKQADKMSDMRNHSSNLDVSQPMNIKEVFSTSTTNKKKPKDKRSKSKYVSNMAKISESKNDDENLNKVNKITIEKSIGTNNPNNIQNPSLANLKKLSQDKEQYNNIEEEPKEENNYNTTSKPKDE